MGQDMLKREIFILQKSSKLAYFFALIFMGITLFLIFHGERYDRYSYKANMGLSGFYALHDISGTLPIPLIYFLMASNGVGLESIMGNKTKFTTFMTLRKSSITTYFISRIFEILLFSFLFSFLTKLVLLIMIHFFFVPLHFDVPPINYGTNLVSGAFSNLLLFLILSSLGFGIFSLLVEVTGLFLKNNYVFRSLGVIVGILLSMAPVFLTAFPQLINVGYIVYLPTLLTPGINGLSRNPSLANLTCTLLSMACYSLISALLFFIYLRKVKKHGY